jgi:hypothetical protein
MFPDVGLLCYESLFSSEQNECLFLVKHSFVAYL